jgi:hypothetical protein
MENSDEIRNLEAQKKEIQDQIDDIQKSCKHKELKANFVQDENGGNRKIMMICTDCNASVRYPTQTELEEFCK